MVCVVLPKLLQHFDVQSKMPIKVRDVRTQIIGLALQDEIVLVPKKMDPKRLYGIYVQEVYRDGVYGEPIRRTYIIYNDNLPLPHKRIICAKELVHALDDQAERTVLPTHVVGLVNRLIGPMSASDTEFGPEEYMALTDKLALYPALAMLFPTVARQIAIDRITRKQATPEMVARWVNLPKPLVDLVLSEDWPAIRQSICKC